MGSASIKSAFSTAMVLILGFLFFFIYAKLDSHPTQVQPEIHPVDSKPAERSKSSELSKPAEVSDLREEDPMDFVRDNYVKAMIHRIEYSTKRREELLSLFPLGSTVTVGTSDITGCIIDIEGDGYKVLFTTGNTVTLGKDILKLKNELKR